MIKYREYKDYDEYLEHQAEKLNKLIAKRQPRIMPKDFNRIKNAFKDRIRLYLDIIPKKSKIICLGARTGCEVAAYREYKYKAIGIDINPGPWQDKKDPLVIKGDFHNIPFEDGYFDVVYINCIDHSYEIPLLSIEMARVLQDHGILILEIPHLGPTVQERQKRKGKYGCITHENKYEACIYDSIDDILKDIIHFNHTKTFQGIHERIVAILEKK